MPTIKHFKSTQPLSTPHLNSLCSSVHILAHCIIWHKLLFSPNLFYFNTIFIIVACSHCATIYHDYNLGLKLSFNLKETKKQNHLRISQVWCCSVRKAHKPFTMEIGWRARLIIRALINKKKTKYGTNLNNPSKLNWMRQFFLQLLQSFFLIFR